MPVPLDEPFFVLGRQSPFQRAVLSSLALAVLSSIAAWIVLAAFLWETWLPDAARTALGRFVGLIYPLATAAMTLLVHGPLNRWRLRSWFRTAIAIPLSIPMLVPLSIFALERARAPLLTSSDFPEAALALMFVLIVPVALQGLPLISNEKTDYRVWLTSILTSSVVGLMILAAISTGSLGNLDTHVPRGLVARAGLIQCWLVAAFVPWGVAFWRPPETNSGETAQM